MQKIETEKTIWLNLTSPTSEDLQELQKELNLSPNVLKDLAGFNKRPQIEEYDGYIFLVIHFPLFNERSRQTIPIELDFLITKNQLITVYQQANPVFEKFFRDCQENLSQQKNYFRNAGFLLFSILDNLIDACLPMLDHIHEKIENIEQQIFESREKEMLKEIAILKRDIIDFRRTIKPQRSVLEILAKKASRLFPPEEMEIIGQEAIGSEIRVWNTLENHKEMIEAIEKTNEGLLSYQISRVMHTLTFFSIILFSLTFTAAFFAIKPVENLFFNRQQFGILMVGGIMLAVILTITVFFKKKRWM